ncbi:MAG: hypothetical protein KAQ90_03825 [Melioribacteraceae bacterium]|nr:hypothetical protein [Melioribacteraceae bacterium]
MNYKKSSEISGELLEKIIATAYGNSPLLDRIKIYNLARKYPDVKILLDEYKQTASGVHSISKEEYPHSVSKIFRENTGFEQKKKSVFADIYAIIFSKPFVSATATVILIIAIITSMFINNNMYNGYSLQDIERANRETKQALLIVSNIFNKTEKSLREDIIAKQVSKPIQEGINKVNYLFIKETKNEN